MLEQQPHPEVRRIGVAIAIPEPWGADLQRWRASFGDPLADAIPTHVTLLPPTEVPAAALHDVEAHLQSVAECQDRFSIHLKGTGTFRPVSPVVFVQLTQGGAECERLESDVREGPLTRPLTFHYHPHVTVAHDLPPAVLDRAVDELADYDATFDVWGFSLFEHGADRVWRPQRDYAFGRPLPGPMAGPAAAPPT